MERARIIKITAIVFLYLSIAVLAGLGIYQYQRIKGAGLGTSDAVSSGGEAVGDILQEKGPVPEKVAVQEPASGEGQAGDRSLEDLRSELSEAEGELAEVNKLIMEYEVRKAEEEKTRLKRQKEAEEYNKRHSETREFKEMQLKSLERSYADLFKRLNLVPEKKERLLEMIIDKGTESNKISREFSAAVKGQTEERLKELTDERIGRIHALDDEYNEKMTDLLGEEGYETYQVYGDSGAERNLVNAFVNLLDSDETLTEDQRWDLAVAMYENNRDIKYAPRSFNRNATQEERIAQNLEYMTSTHEGYLNAAGDVLSASQLAKLDEYLKGQRDQLKRNMERSALMPGAQTTD